MFRNVLAIAGLVLGLAAPADIARAGNYPDKPVKIVVPYPAGGPGDVVTRVVADALARKLSGTFIVENIPGGTQVIGARRAASAPPDGYTLFLGSLTSLAINPNMNHSLPYNPVADFAPITLLNMTPQILVAGPRFPATRIQEVIALAEKEPGKLTYASVGVGSSAYFAGELFNALTGVHVTHVPYTGAGPALKDVMAGDVDMTYTTGVLNYIAGGQLKALAVTSPTRTPALPDTPTLVEAGLKEFDQSIWWGLLAPKGTPADIIELISEAVRDSAKSGELHKNLGPLGEETQIVASTPDEFRTFIGTELAKWHDVIGRIKPTAPDQRPVR